MEMFLLYLWLKIDTIIFLLGLTAVALAIIYAGLACFTGNKWKPKTIPIPFEEWILNKEHSWEVRYYGMDSKHIRENYENTVTYHRTLIVFKWLPMVSVFLFVCSLMIPNKTDIAVLVGGSYALDVAKSPEAAKLMTVIRGKANEILDKEIKDLKENK